MTLFYILQISIMPVNKRQLNTYINFSVFFMLQCIISMCEKMQPHSDMNES